MIVNGQVSEIIKLDEKNAYQYKSYYEDGSIKSVVGFYTKRPYSSVEEFEEKLKRYKVRRHGARKEYYPNGQLKEIVIYRKGRVVETMKTYFEDGEEYSVVTDELPKFQFDFNDRDNWIQSRINELELKYDIRLDLQGMIVLEIRKDGTIKSLNVRAADKSNEKYLLEIGNQIEVLEPAKKNGQNIGTRFAFRFESKK
jgi:antitoxin component YwqK of YwqJK toxin-antitoxin module